MTFKEYFKYCRSIYGEDSVAGDLADLAEEFYKYMCEYECNMKLFTVPDTGAEIVK